MPVADMLNHHPGQHVAWHTGSQAADAFQIATFKEVAEVIQGFKPDLCTASKDSIA